MSRRFDLDEQEAERKREERQARLIDGMFRADVQTVLQSPSARRVLGRFLREVGMDTSPFNTNAMAQSRNIGLQDAGKWWFNAIREHCPEQEIPVRREMYPPPLPEESTNDD